MNRKIFIRNRPLDEIDLEDLQNYISDSFKLLSESIHSGQVVKGLDVTLSSGRTVEVNPGMAYDNSYNIINIKSKQQKVIDSGDSLPRYDLIYLEYKTNTVNNIDTQNKYGLGSSLIYSQDVLESYTIGVIKGTPNSNPTKPSTSSNRIPLAHIYVPASASSLTSGNIEDAKNYIDISTKFNMNDSTMVSTNEGTIRDLLSSIANRLKSVTGKSDWKTSPRTTLENVVKKNGDTMSDQLILDNANYNKHLKVRRYTGGTEYGFQATAGSNGEINFIKLAGSNKYVFDADVYTENSLFANSVRADGNSIFGGTDNPTIDLAIGKSNTGLNYSATNTFQLMSGGAAKASVGPSGFSIYGEGYVDGSLIFHAGNFDPSSKVNTTRNINTGNGLTGGGTLASDRNLSVDLNYFNSRFLQSTGGSLTGSIDLNDNRIDDALYIGFSNYSTDNYDHIWFDESPNIFHFVKDSAPGSVGNANLKVGQSIFMEDTGEVEFALRGIRLKADNRNYFYVDKDDRARIWLNNVAVFQFDIEDADNHGLLRIGNTIVKGLNGSIEQVQIRNKANTAYGNMRLDTMYYNSLVNNSSEKIKKGIEKNNFKEALSILKSIDTYNFHYKQDNDEIRKRTGTIFEHAPLEIQSVTGKGIDLSALAFLNKDGIIELEERVKKLEDKLNNM